MLYSSLQCRAASSISIAGFFTASSRFGVILLWMAALSRPITPELICLECLFFCVPLGGPRPSPQVTLFSSWNSCRLFLLSILATSTCSNDCAVQDNSADMEHGTEALLHSSISWTPGAALAIFRSRETHVFRELDIRTRTRSCIAPSN